MICYNDKVNSEKLDNLLAETDDLFKRVSNVIPTTISNMPVNTKIVPEVPTIMLIDDNGMVLRAMNRILSSDYKVILANSGKKAFEQLKRYTPDLILLDFEMPEMNGPEFLVKLREIQEYASIPVIFLTGVSDREHIATAIKLHPAGYLIKPVTTERLFHSIDVTLANLGPGNMAE